MPLLYIYLFSRTQTRRDVDKGNLSVGPKHHFYPFPSHHQSMASHALDRLQQQRMKRHLQGQVKMLLIHLLQIMFPLPGNLGIPLPVTFVEHLWHRNRMQRHLNQEPVIQKLAFHPIQ